jgi:hypothetical protein
MKMLADILEGHEISRLTTLPTKLRLGKPVNRLLF